MGIVHNEINKKTNKHTSPTTNSCFVLKELIKNVLYHHKLALDLTVLVFQILQI